MDNAVSTKSLGSSSSQLVYTNGDPSLQAKCDAPSHGPVDHPPIQNSMKPYEFRTGTAGD
ncbi:hypothetical protein AAVH_26646 [Aphelenchoides avenae]|nr:hypothetical protein AAVH_26646 [Aphelenchus avenae]